MQNIFFALDRLRSTLLAREVDSYIVESIVQQAHREIQSAVEARGRAAVDQAVEAGIDKKSPEFINELRLDTVNFEVETDSGNTDFSTPPRPMLPFLLKNAKPMKDGSGVYKVIPVGKPSNKPNISTNIYDVQKKIAAERAEESRVRYNSIVPSGSVNTTYRTATSKQDANTQWVMPAKDKDFSEELKAINQNLKVEIDDEIDAIISSYEDLY